MLSQQLKYDLQKLFHELVQEGDLAFYCSIREVVDVDDTFIIQHRGEQFEMASLAKLPIAWFLLESFPKMLHQRVMTLEEQDQLTSNGSPVGGTGLLKHCKPGLQLTAAEVLALMLKESDNVAANWLIRSLCDYPTRVNDWIAEQLPPQHLGMNPGTGLVDLVAPKFGSTVGNPAMVVDIWDELVDCLYRQTVDLNSPAAMQAMQALANSHDNSGLAYGRRRSALEQVRVKTMSVTGWASRDFHQNMIRAILNSRPKTGSAELFSKEGVLPAINSEPPVRHEVARCGYKTVALFAQGLGLNDARNLATKVAQAAQL